MTEPGRGAIQLLTADNVRKLLLCAAYVVTSGALIRFNKYLMTDGRFPFSMALTAVHMTVSTALCLALYCAAPSAFPGVVSSSGKRRLLVQWFAPIGAAFAVSLYASNAAYRYCSVSFLQFMKEGNVIIAFMISCAVGLQVLSRVRVAVIVWVTAGSALAITGEVHFVLIGFTFQIASQLAECSRAVMGESVLRGAGLKLDPLSYTMFVAPTCLAVLLVGNVFMWNPAIPQQAAEWWRHLLPNALLAFLLNVIVAAVIKEVSAVGFMLTGMVKDIVIVLFSCAFFGEAVTTMQLVGFVVALAGVFFWSYLKVAPDSPAACFAEALLGLPGRHAADADAKLPDESSALLAAAKA